MLVQEPWSSLPPRHLLLLSLDSILRYLGLNPWSNGDTGVGTDLIKYREEIARSLGFSDLIVSVDPIS